MVCILFKHSLNLSTPLGSESGDLDDKMILQGQIISLGMTTEFFDIVRRISRKRTQPHFPNERGLEGKKKQEQPTPSGPANSQKEKKKRAGVYKVWVWEYSTWEYSEGVDKCVDRSQGAGCGIVKKKGEVGLVVIEAKEGQ